MVGLRHSFEEWPSLGRRRRFCVRAIIPSSSHPSSPHRSTPKAPHLAPAHFAQATPSITGACGMRWVERPAALPASNAACVAHPPNTDRPTDPPFLNPHPPTHRFHPHQPAKSTMPQLSWEETRSIMAEVQELFAGREVRASYVGCWWWGGSSINASNAMIGDRCCWDVCAHAAPFHPRPTMATTDTTRHVHRT